ncbi:MAG: hypothetical protein WD294_11920 [Phycisphaeraceae bacterium]
MSKMFYTLEETAEKLGCDDAQVKAMVEAGKLQQFRDRDQLMFKVDQVDKVAASEAASNDVNDDSGIIGVEDNVGEKSDTIDLADTGSEPSPPASATASGLNLLDDEEDGGDASERTQMSDSFTADASDLSLDSIGSGSGLLDLTQESDDTSLGSVELLDDVPSDSGLSSDSKMGESSDVLAGSSTGIFDAAGGAESSAAGFTAGGSMDDEALQPVAYDSGDSDGFSAGMLAGVFVVLVVGLLVALPGTRGIVTGLATTLAEGEYGMYYGALAGLCVVFGVVGMFVSRR